MNQREIKFRAWNKIPKTMTVVPFSVDNKRIEIDAYCDEDSSRFEIMQYTGLKDKNGKEIYEGDLIKYSGGRLYRVKWVGAGFWFVTSGLPDVEITPNEVRFVEVIGNIYENLELLK